MCGVSHCVKLLAYRSVQPSSEVFVSGIGGADGKFREIALRGVGGEGGEMGKLHSAVKVSFVIGKENGASVSYLIFACFLDYDGIRRIGLLIGDEVQSVSVSYHGDIAAYGKSESLRSVLDMAAKLFQSAVAPQKLH